VILRYKEKQKDIYLSKKKRDDIIGYKDLKKRKI
jgi:hypothetical protein